MLNYDEGARDHVEGPRQLTDLEELAMETFAPLEDVMSSASIAGVPLQEAAARGLVGNDNRIGDFSQVYSARKFWPLDPRPEEVHIEDIAHSLAMQCRWGGHCIRFLSVAEHSVHVAMSLPRKHALWGLLHDGSEAYVTDVPRPLKYSIQNYREYEDNVMRAICDRYGLPHEVPEAVKWADDAILGDEIDQNMHPMPWQSAFKDRLGVDLQFWTPERAEDEFLSLFWILMGK